MIPEIYWIGKVENGKLAVMPRPRGNDWLEDEISGYINFGIDIIVSFLTKPEEKELGLLDEGRICSEKGIEFISFPVLDRCEPDSKDKFIDLISSVYTKLIEGKNVSFHCRMGIGRAGIAATTVLIKSGMNSEDSFAKVSESRKLKVPDTQEQINWVKSLESDLIN